MTLHLIRLPIRMSALARWGADRGWAQGKSGAELITSLNNRLNNTEAQELDHAREALLHITLKRLRDIAQDTIVLAPEQLALSYITNSTILQFVTVLGVKLDIFFRLLWRHVLVVEFIRKHASLQSEASTKNLFERLKGRLDTRRRSSIERVLSYMEKKYNALAIKTAKKVFLEEEL